MSLFSCRACAVHTKTAADLRLSHDAELDRATAREALLLSQIRDLTAKLTALADVRATQVLTQADATHIRAEHLARTAADADARRAAGDPVIPGLVTADRLPAVMRAALGMSGHYRSPIVAVDARTLAAQEARAASAQAASTAHARGQEDVQDSATTQPV